MTESYLINREFVSMVLHEMRNPIQSILTSSELLLEKSARRYDLITAISRNALRLERMSSNLLNFARIENQALELNKERFELSHVVSDILSDFRNQIKSKKFGQRNLTLSFAKRCIFINADKDGVIQAITNLVDNACKFTKVGDISVSIAKKGTDVVIAVRDTGSGIDSNMLPRLFSRFATTSYGGLGLGLYITKKIVEAHGGTIWATNNPDGKGSLFAFSIPA
jgi:signal transduction histidine kinase